MAYEQTEKITATLNFMKKNSSLLIVFTLQKAQNKFPIIVKVIVLQIEIHIISKTKW